MATTFTTGQNLPPPQSPFVDPSTGFLSNDGYQWLMDLVNRLANAIPTASVEKNISAQGHSQATALPLTAQWNEVDTAAALVNDGVLLEPLQEGQSQIIANNSGIPINVWPPVGVQIDALGVNQPYALATATNKTFKFFSATQIRS